MLCLRTCAVAEAPSCHSPYVACCLCCQDPLADGVTIHTAATRALQKGTTLDRVIDMVSKVAPTLDAPLVLFTYFNPIIRRGMDKFCQQIKAAGAAGAQQQQQQEPAAAP